MVGEKKGLFGREEVDPGVYFVADLVTRATRDVASAPPSAELPLPEASGLSYVSGPVLAGVGIETGSPMVGIVPGVLRGFWVILSSSLMKEGLTRGLGVTNEIGSGVEPVGGVGSSLIRSAMGSSGPICIVSIQAGCGVASTLCAWLRSPSSSLTTSSTIVFTGTSLGAIVGSTACFLGGEVYSGLAGTSSSLVGLEGPVDPVWSTSPLAQFLFSTPLSLGSPMRCQGDSPLLQVAPPVVAHQIGPSSCLVAPPSSRLNLPRLELSFRLRLDSWPSLRRTA